MAFKFDIGDSKHKKTYHLEAEAENLVGMKIGDSIKGEDIKPELAGCEFIITGMSDKAGFPSLKTAEGVGLRRVLLRKGFSLHKLKKPKKTAPRPDIPKGYRKRRTLRGNTISSDIVQINLKTVKSEKSIGELLGKEAKPEAKAEEKRE